MKLSIIIPSYKRAELLDAGLYSLAQYKTMQPYEIIVCNDGIKDDTENICKKYKDKLNIKYIFTGQRNNNEKLIWRIPGFALNIGVSKAKGKFIILTSPEIFVLNNCIDEIISILTKNNKALVITEGMHDASGEVLKKFKDTGIITENDFNNKHNTILDTNLPFFMALSKNEFNSINGYDENFTGYCFDDADLVDRLIYNGCEYHQISAKIIHLYHSRQNREGLSDKVTAWQFNKTLYEESKRKRNKIPISLSQKIPKPFITTSKNIINKIIPKDKEIIDVILSNNWELINIPKIAHFYWGEKTLPYLRYLTIQSFHAYNPDWEIRFYYPKYRKHGKSWKTHEHKYDINISKDYTSLLKKIPMKNIEIDFDLINISNELSEVHKSDYLRWHLLAEVGGLWSDMDIIYIDSMNNMHINIKNNRNVNSVICYHLPWKHSIGFLLSSNNSALYDDLKKAAYKRKYDSTDYQTVGSLLMNPTVKSLEEANQKYPNVANVSMDTVYSYNTFLIRVMLDSKNLAYITKNTIGLHWYAGHPKAGVVVSTLNESNYKILNNVVSEVVDISLNKTKDEIIKFTTAFNFNKKKEQKKLTIHSVIKNEPFIYYSIKSIYDYADKILLYDTCSDDKYTIKDIKQLLKEDKKGKIIYKQIPLDFDESKWTFDKVNEFAKKYVGKMSVGKVRQIQIDDTDTEFCMLVDGDEIHYRSTMEKIINDILPYLSKNIIGVNIPLIWFYNMKQVFRVPGLENTGRIWRTNEVVMNGISPNEAHCFKSTGKEIAVTDKEYLIYKDLIPYAHFETFLKPWRRKINKSQLSIFKGELPEAMKENPYYINRYLKEKDNLK